MAPQITLANVTQPTNQEWNNDWDAVNAHITTTQPNTVVEQTPAALVPNPTKTMSHLQAQATPAAVPKPTVAPAVQLINGDGKYRKTTSLAAFGAVPLPWSQNWDLFKAQFSLRFEDRQKRKRAMDNLMNGKVVQATGVRKFVDQVRDTCQKTGCVRIAFIYYLLYGSLLVHCHHVVNKGRCLSPSAGCSSCRSHTSHLGLKGYEP